MSAEEILEFLLAAVRHDRSFIESLIRELKKAAAEKFSVPEGEVYIYNIQLSPTRPEEFDTTVRRLMLESTFSVTANIKTKSNIDSDFVCNAKGTFTALFSRLQGVSSPISIMYDVTEVKYLKQEMVEF